MKLRKLACIIATAAIACAVAVPMAACNKKDDGVEVGDDGVMRATEITMWVGGSEWSGRNLQNLQKFISDYNSVKPDGFTVTLSRKDDLEKSFQTSRTNGKQ